MKRQRQNDVSENSNKNKKRRLVDENNNIIYKSILEDLANELFYEIFEYLDIYQMYKSFFNLNIRFQNLSKNSNLLIKINVSTMSKSNFEDYYNDIILPNKHRINYLRLSNPFTVDIAFSPPRIITKFLQLETLVFDNIDAKYLKNILNHSINLPKFHSLVLNFTGCVPDPDKLFFYVFRLPKLKYFKLSYQSEEPQCFVVNFDKCESSSIEHLVINCGFLTNSFNDLLYCLPKLRHLSIDGLIGYPYKNLKLSHIFLKDFKYLSLNIYNVLFNGLELLIKHYFRSIEVLRITTRCDNSYLDAQRWEELILSFMPNLRVFDFFNKTHLAFVNPETYHDIVHQFTSPFWIEKQWFFTHQHNWQGTDIESGIFYSTNPYRRKDYKFYWESDTHICPHLEEKNLNSIKHVDIRNERMIDKNLINYFPNITELTFRNPPTEYDDTLITSLNCMMPLKQLTKLIIFHCNFPFDEFIELLYLTPNLQTLKFNVKKLDETSSKLLEQSQIFQHVSNTNKITNLEILGWSTSLERLQLYFNLFPQLEYFKTGTDKKQIEQIIRFIFSKSTNTPHHLFFLCISRLPKRCLKELKILIKSQNLLDDFFIKRINRELYLWW